MIGSLRPLFLRCIGLVGFMPRCSRSGRTLCSSCAEHGVNPEAPEVLRLNASADWSGQNAVFEREAGTASSLVIVNADTTSHVWALLLGETEGITIEPGDTAVVDLPALPMGTYRLGLIDGEGSGLGAQSMLNTPVGWKPCLVSSEFVRLGNSANGFLEQWYGA